MQVTQPMGATAVPNDSAMKSLAKKVETQFLSEMLRSAGLGKMPETFGGGSGEDQFSSFLVNEYAAKLVDAGGLGLAEAIYHSLVERGASK